MSEYKMSTMRGVRTFLKVGSCSETAFNVIDRGFGNPHVHEENASMPFAGGILQHGYQCGLLWGSALAAGTEAYRRFGPTPKAEAGAVFAAQRVIEAFRGRYGEINCLELIETDWRNKAQVVRYMLKGGSFRCFGMAGKFTQTAHRIIDEALSEETFPVTDAPVSCAAELARKMGATEEQVVMAAGLTGGIGLSGGACGALGAAMWLMALKHGEGENKVDYKDPRGHTLVEAFLESSDFEFECEKIVGRRFSDTAEHAAFVREGGCAALIGRITEAAAVL
ncbi:MAG: hypothetical protein C0600_07785 [Ignavibacteria bacterium]|nr:MAG: hypothetical protein C0600_07785 [Ignavibacteria bacterium]